jgi:exosome complex RNA-binding protein Rrp42 (RNase PH superfamily)
MPAVVQAHICTTQTESTSLVKSTLEKKKVSLLRYTVTTSYNCKVSEVCKSVSRNSDQQCTSTAVETSFRNVFNYKQKAIHHIPKLFGLWPF